MITQIISKDMLAYLEEQGRSLSDREIATIVYHAGLSMPELLQALSELKHQTKDTELAQEIEERITYEQRCLERFRENDGSCFYETSIVEEDGENTVTGHFAALALAEKHTKQFVFHHNKPFVIKKYQIVGLCEKVIVPICWVNPRLHPKAASVPCEYYGSAISGCRYRADGSLLEWWSFELQEEERAVEDWGEHRFECKFLDLPNPFQRGDIVRVFGKDEVGIVATSQEEYQEFLCRVKEHKLPVDFIDSSIIVLFLQDEGDDTHGHIPPVYLERTQTNTDTEKQLRALLKD